MFVAFERAPWLCFPGFSSIHFCPSIFLIPSSCLSLSLSLAKVEAGGIPVDFDGRVIGLNKEGMPLRDFGKTVLKTILRFENVHSPLSSDNVTQSMQIPLSYADAVIGTSGANISYIRRASGASIAIQETRGVPGEMTVEINGSASQVQTAQQLIQNSLAEAASSTQNPTTAPTGPAYNFPSHGPVYASPPSHPGGHAGHAPPGDYTSVYGTNYGY